jgi:hypothetical protein
VHYLFDTDKFRDKLKMEALERRQKIAEKQKEIIAVREKSEDEK